MGSAFAVFLDSFSRSYKNARRGDSTPRNVGLHEFMSGALELMPGSPAIVLTINDKSCNYGTTIGMAPLVATATRHSGGTHATVEIYSHSFQEDAARIVADQMAHTVALIESQ